MDNGSLLSLNVTMELKADGEDSEVPRGTDCSKLSETPVQSPETSAANESRHLHENLPARQIGTHSTAQKETELQTMPFSGEENTGDDDEESKARKLRTIKMNVGAICLVWVFTFTAYSGLQNLESSLNARVGTYSLAGITGGGFITCLLAPAVISKIGCKGALVISWVCLAVFVGANYYPRAYVLIPGAVVEGLATGRMWTAQGVYVTTCAFEYSQLTGEALDEVLSRMFGVFCMAFQSTQVWGNLISSVVLNKEQAAGHRDNSTAE